MGRMKTPAEILREIQGLASHAEVHSIPFAWETLIIRSPVASKQTDPTELHFELPGHWVLERESNV
jgi:hypothetical protein